MREAEAALKQAVEKAAAKGREPSAALRKLRELDRDSLDLEGRIAAAKYNLENERSPIRPAVESDEALAGRRAQLQTLEAEIQHQPSRDLRFAQETHANARWAYEEALGAARKSASGYDDADVGRRRAEMALRKAERSDPRLTTIAEEKARWQRKRDAVVAEVKEVAEAREAHRRLEVEIEKIQDQRRALIEQAADQNRAMLDGSDPRVAAARKRLEDARRDVKNIENSADMVAAANRVEGVRAELERKVRELSQADPGYLAAARQIAAIDAQIAALGSGKAGP
jgi:chromosome segregation ATPase